MIEISEDRIVDFFSFVNERHLIYINRQNGNKWPWTNDPILQKYKFTNIFRELDTGTIWLRENIREQYPDHQELFFNIAMYRLYNYWPTAKYILQEVGYIYDYKKQQKELLDCVRWRKSKGEQIFTGAHMITGTLGGDKIHQVFELCLGNLWNERKERQPKPGDTLEKAFNRLLGATGYAGFITYEVITDLRHTRYLRDASDIMTWANPGPGAKRGINRLLGLKVRDTTKEERAKYPKDKDYIKIMQFLLDISVTYKQMFVPKMEMRDIEHSLCEFDKYERARLGEGKPRSRYVSKDKV